MSQINRARVLPFRDVFTDAVRITVAPAVERRCSAAFTSLLDIRYTAGVSNGLRRRFSMGRDCQLTSVYRHAWLNFAVLNSMPAVKKFTIHRGD